jgi:hypothetical protein
MRQLTLPGCEEIPQECFWIARLEYTEMNFCRFIDQEIKLGGFTVMFDFLADLAMSLVIAFVIIKVILQIVNSYKK